MFGAHYSGSSGIKPYKNGQRRMDESKQFESKLQGRHFSFIPGKATKAHRTFSTTQSRGLKSCSVFEETWVQISTRRPTIQVLLWFCSVFPRKCRDSTFQQATTISIHILPNSLVTKPMIRRYITRATNGVVKRCRTGRYSVLSSITVCTFHSILLYLRLT